MFGCVSDGDVGGLRAPAEAAALHISRGPVVTSAVVFIVHTLPGVQSKHGRHSQAPHRLGQEANLFICQLLTELFISSLKHKPELLN